MLLGISVALVVIVSVVGSLVTDTGAGSVIIALLVAIVVTIAAFWRVRLAAALLLVPYLAWVGYATALTIAIALRN